MYPPNYCTGDSHEYPGYVCSYCHGTDISEMGGKPSNDTPDVLFEYSDSEYSDSDIDTVKQVKLRHIDKQTMNTNTTSDIITLEVDGWPVKQAGRSRVGSSYEYYWIARASRAYPDGVVRIPDQLYEGSSYDGKSYVAKMKRDNEYLSKTRQSYLRAAAAK